MYNSYGAHKNKIEQVIIVETVALYSHRKIITQIVVNKGKSHASLIGL